VSLKSIAIKDFVIVESLDLDFQSGFSVLTGETGAGKSILIDALQLALGARADVGVVREGAARCEISAEFDCPPALLEMLENGGFASESSVLLRRTVDVQGKSRAWINGSAATAAQLKEVGDSLVDIHGQHAWQSLSRPDSVRSLLDAFGGVSTQALAEHWRAWRHAQKELTQALAAQNTQQQERERLAWQIDEASKLAPQLNEWEDLNVQHQRLSNGQALLDAMQIACDCLGDSDANASALTGKAMAQLQALQHIEPRFGPLAEVLASALAQLDDVHHSLRSFATSTELEPERLKQLDKRLSDWLNLARRYKLNPAELAARWQSWKTELAQLDASGDVTRLAQLDQQAQQRFEKEAASVSQLRSRAAPKLAKAITQAMQGLGMTGGRFEVVLTPLEQAAQFGAEQAEFLVAAHPGATPKAVGKVASGGELSRLALAIAVTTSQLGQAQTLIFDEVDSGVGGAVADTVGQLMRQLGADRQVLAVTHLAQVAARADHHFVVAKASSGSGKAASTVSTVKPIDTPARVDEIARMLGGERASATGLALAREMLSA
jgi:DNA repair protein RecN (Recombination protein N)